MRASGRAWHAACQDSGAVPDSLPNPPLGTKGSVKAEPFFSAPPNGTQHGSFLGFAPFRSKLRNTECTRVRSRLPRHRRRRCRCGVSDPSRLRDLQFDVRLPARTVGPLYSRISDDVAIRTISLPDCSAPNVRPPHSSPAVRPVACVTMCRPSQTGLRSRFHCRR